MNGEININVFVESALRLYNLYQILEVTDEVTEDDPGFDLMCDTCEVIFDVTFDMMNELVDVVDVDPQIKQMFAEIKGNICSVNDLG